MAQANSVQREPSMEEILASIRRIIEDSDTARKDLDDEEDEAGAVEGVAEPATQVEVFRRELTEEEPVPPAAPVRVQADFAREPVVNPEPVREAWPRPLPRMREPEFEAPPHEGPIAFVHEDIEDEAPAIDAVQAENQNPKPAILSDHTGRQVAASFGELSEAFASTRRRSFDEMAEDMMRPMLQDWLDNNLPLLVEKLVREEIERVARGGAR